MLADFSVHRDGKKLPIARALASFHGGKNTIDKAIAYLRSMTDRSGDVFYLNLGNRLSTSTARVSIATLACAVARRKDLAKYKATINYLYFPQPSLLSCS